MTTCATATPPRTTTGATSTLSTGSAPRTYYELDYFEGVTYGPAAESFVADMVELAGGFGIFKRSGLEQIFRDARLGRIHPGNSMFTHELVGKTVLGIDPDETPRWG